MLGKNIGRRLERPLTRFALFIPFSPNTVTVIGFVFMIFASSLLAVDLRTGGILVLVAGFLDVLDGAIARAKGMVTSFGAYLDSVLDRYADAAAMLAIAWYMYMHGNGVGILLSLVSFVGSFLVSYARARAEGLGASCTHGLMERPERIILLAAGAISGYIIPALWIMAVLTHFTVIQRIIHTKKQLSRRKD
ncbi:MAG: CDP-alcohol phosphatidyltransferase family protein [Nitrospirae bacterium]|nr:CDP-alcohol phosphatidyltransferase family protein [Nitrospirota bacterium]